MIAEILAPLVKPHLQQLTQAEQQLVQSLTQHPSAGLFMSARELASTAGVHPSSAVRLAKKLGFDGYPEFRRSLQQSHGAGQRGSAQRVARTVATTADGDILGHLLRQERESLRQIEGCVSQPQIDQAATCLIRASGIKIWAAGNAKVLADLLDRRLRRAGFAAQNIASEGRELAERLVPMQSSDVLVAFAFRREPAGLGVALSHARQAGITSILIADTVAHTLRTPADITLAAPRGLNDDFLTLNVPMLITNALVLTLARLDSGRSMAGLQKLEDLYAQLESAG
jgi:DNA-binding MurR/RpiR family transcriptional regulator